MLEFLIVLAIILILVAILLPNLLKSKQKSQDEKLVTDVRVIALGLEEFKQICGAYPSQLERLQTCEGDADPTTMVLGDLIPNFDSYKFNDSDSLFMYAPLTLGSVDECNAFHLGVRLTNSAEGSLGVGDSNFDSRSVNPCQIAPAPNRFDGNVPNVYDIMR